MNDVRLLTLEGARSHDLAVEQWFGTPPAGLRAVARRWFDELRACGPDVLELLHDGHPTACIGDLAFAYVNAFASHVNVGFFFGTVLHDPEGLLEGTGRYMRHVKLGQGTFAGEAALQRLIHAAYADIRKRSPTR